MPVDDQVIRLALETAGVEFNDANGGGPGVLLRKARPEKPERQKV
jgi:hypothetical protein